MKKLLKQALGFFLSSDPIIWLYLRIRNKGPRIILYHGVSDLDYEKKSSQVIAKEVFAEQMQYLKKHYVNVSLADLIAARGAGKSHKSNEVTITFDDGYENNCKYAVPLLLSHGFTACIFINPEYTEMAQNEQQMIFWWDILDRILNEDNYTDFISIFEQNGIKISPYKSIEILRLELEQLLMNIPVEINEKITSDLKEKFKGEILNERFIGVMNWQQLRDLIGQGIEVGSHSMSHVTASKLPPDRFHTEFFQSKRIMEKKIGAVETFAFPYGGKKHYTQETVKALKRAGYKCALLVLKGDKTDDSFCIDRYSIAKGDDFRMFKIKTAGIFNDIEIAFKWLEGLWKKIKEDEIKPGGYE